MPLQLQSSFYRRNYLYKSTADFTAFKSFLLTFYSHMKTSYLLQLSEVKEWKFLDKIIYKNKQTSFKVWTTNRRDITTRHANTGKTEQKADWTWWILCIPYWQTVYLLGDLKMATDPPSVQFSSVTQSCPTLYNPMDCSMPGFPFYHQLPELIQTHVRRVGDAIQPSHPR